MEIMSTTLLDERKYRKLLDKVLPVIIHSEEEHRRLLQAAAHLMAIPEPEMTEEEGRLLEMLSMLIEEYEDRVHPLPETEPHKMLAHLLGEKGLKPSDLWTVLPKSRVSEILSGKRSISKSQAKGLARLFNAPVELFL
jgi:HTH-type transcriptional regulator / antitoxin HigA